MKNKERLIVWMQANEGCYVHPEDGYLAFNLGDGSHEYTFEGMLCGASGLGRYISQDDEEPTFEMYDGTPADLFCAPDKVLEVFGIDDKESEDITRRMKEAKIRTMRQAIMWTKENL